MTVGTTQQKMAKVTVPRETTVRIFNFGIGANASCWVSDTNDQVVFTRGMDKCAAFVS